MKTKLMLAASAAVVAFATQAFAEDPSTPVSQVVVTATRAPAPVDQVPADISVVSGADLRARDAHDMASALALVPGVEAPAGGDAGPSSAVPSFMGLHEFDAFLLVVDNVPWGGAFNPMITTLDMNDVERIEVLKGSAPVMYGATSFVGVVQELHYPAGRAANQIDLAYGNYDSVKGDASFALPQVGDYRSSFAISGEHRGFADRREEVSDGKALYRGALDLGQDEHFTIDADVTIVRDKPPSPVQSDGVGLSPLNPINANFNPANAAINQDEFHIALGYERPTPLGQWSTLVSVAHSNIRDIRAFLHPDFSGDADSQDQTRKIDDDYADTHLTNTFGASTLIVGADLLYGHGTQTSLNGNGGYNVPLDGSVVPPSTELIPVNEIGTVNDRRLFTGQYIQFDWKPDDRLDVTAGVRLNETNEHKVSSDFTTPPPAIDVETRSRNDLRLSETLGASYRAWRDGPDEVVLYADFRYAFKPAAIDFGPDFTPDILAPETAESYEAGIKGALAGGKLTFDAEAFQLDFHNLVVPTLSGSLANAAGERLRGAEVETRWVLAPDLALAANIAWHDATFTNYLFVDDSGLGVNVAGNQLPLSPHWLASAGLIYAPPHGLNGALVLNYVGKRYLDEENTAPVGAYTTVAASVGYNFDRWGVTLEGENLTNERPPVSASEFGSGSFYLLNARTVWLRLSYRL